jgi:hypothetical protein
MYMLWLINTKFKFVVITNSNILKKMKHMKTKKKTPSKNTLKLQ